MLHQADWISGLFSGRFDVTDENNALKTGYDPVARCWPDWVERAGMLPDRLPNVVEPGTITGNILHNRAAEFGLPANTMIVAGTTDGCAAFLAAGASKLGEAVTSLGSTLVLKFLCDRPCFERTRTRSSEKCRPIAAPPLFEAPPLTQPAAVLWL